MRSRRCPVLCAFAALSGSAAMSRPRRRPPPTARRRLLSPPLRLGAQPPRPSPRGRHRGRLPAGPGCSRKSTRPGASGVVELAPFEFLDRLADLIPQPRKHRNRDHGVFAPNHPLRRAVTALAVGNVGKRRDATPSPPLPLGEGRGEGPCGHLGCHLPRPDRAARRGVPPRRRRGAVSARLLRRSRGPRGDGAGGDRPRHDAPLVRRRGTKCRVAAIVHPRIAIPPEAAVHREEASLRLPHDARSWASSRTFTCAARPAATRWSAVTAAARRCSTSRGTTSTGNCSIGDTSRCRSPPGHARVHGLVR